VNIRTRQSSQHSRIEVGNLNDIGYLDLANIHLY